MLEMLNHILYDENVQFIFVNKALLFILSKENVFVLYILMFLTRNQLAFLIDMIKWFVYCYLGEVTRVAAN